MKKTMLLVVATVVAFYAGQAFAAGDNCPNSPKNRRALRGPAATVAKAHLGGGAVPGQSSANRKVR